MCSGGTLKGPLAALIRQGESLTRRVLHRDQCQGVCRKTCTTRSPGDTGHCAALAGAQTLRLPLTQRGSTRASVRMSWTTGGRRPKECNSCLGPCSRIPTGRCNCTWIRLLALHRHSPEGNRAVETLHVGYKKRGGSFTKKHEGSPTSCKGGPIPGVCCSQQHQGDDPDKE